MIKKEQDEAALAQLLRGCTVCNSTDIVFYGYGSGTVTPHFYTTEKASSIMIITADLHRRSKHTKRVASNPVLLCPIQFSISPRHHDACRADDILCAAGFFCASSFLRYRRSTKLTCTGIPASGATTPDRELAHSIYSTSKDPERPHTVPTILGCRLTGRISTRAFRAGGFDIQ